MKEIDPKERKQRERQGEYKKKKKGKDNWHLALFISSNISCCSWREKYHWTSLFFLVISLSECSFSCSFRPLDVRIHSIFSTLSFSSSHFLYFSLLLHPSCSLALFLTHSNIFLPLVSSEISLLLTLFSCIAMTVTSFMSIEWGQEWGQDGVSSLYLYHYHCFSSFSLKGSPSSWVPLSLLSCYRMAFKIKYRNLSTYKKCCIRRSRISRNPYFSPRDRNRECGHR